MAFDEIFARCETAQLYGMHIRRMDEKYIFFLLLLLMMLRNYVLLLLLLNIIDSEINAVGRQ